jgi:hypothetical protein
MPSADVIDRLSTARPLAALTDDALVEELASFAGTIAATEARFLDHVVELDVRGLWARHGARSTAHWLSWRLGLRLNAARERVRVAHALLHLPAISACFHRGELSYCKVRALTRVATPSSEDQLLEIALGTTGAQLERVIRSWRNVLVAERSASATLSRSLRRRTEADGSVVYTLRVPPDDAAVLDVALDRARSIVLDDHGEPVETPEETELASELVNGTPWLRAAADAFVLVAESFVATGVGSPGDGLAVIVHADLDALDPPNLSDELDDDGAVGDRDGRVRAAPGRSPFRSPEGQPLLPATALRRMCEASVVVMAHRGGLPVDLGRAARHASLRQRRLLTERDGGCCRFPSCTQRRRLIPHHVQWWSRDGRTDLDNLVLLCRAHHRAVHDVGYTVVAEGGGRFRFGTPAGRQLPDTWRTTASGASDTVPSDTVPSDPAEVAARRQPAWGGERLDLRLLIDAMVANTVLASGHRPPDVPVSEIPRLVREAVGWPMSGAA